MKSQQSSGAILRRLPLKNLLNRPFRTTGLILLVMLLSLTIFGGSVLALSMRRGLESVEARFGADLIAVPLGYDTGMESILLKGEPSYFYLNKNYVKKIAAVKGVAQVSAQFYLTSTGSPCCEFPVQLIGFDPKTDFAIQPWIKQSYGHSLSDDALLVGSDIQVKNGKTLTFFSRKYPVAAKLERTGTGLDTAVYANMDTLYNLMEASREKGFHFLDKTDPKSVVSSVLIKKADGYDAETVAHNIRAALNGMQIVQTKSMISGIAQSLGSFAKLLLFLIGTFLLLSLAMLGIVFSVTAHERKKEFAILRTLGATKKRLAGLLLRESLLLSAGGGIAGTAVAALAVFPFSVAISQKLGLPYLTPTATQTGVLVILCLGISFAVGPVAAAASAWRIGRADASLTLREGE